MSAQSDAMQSAESYFLKTSDASEHANKTKLIEQLVEKDVYDFKKGVVVIVDHRIVNGSEEPVNGNQQDVELIRSTLTPLGFENPDFAYLRDLKNSDLSTSLNEVAEKLDKEGQYDCLIVFVLSFSSEKNLIHASDDIYKLDVLFTQVEKTFVGKPKIFVIRTPEHIATATGGRSASPPPYDPEGDALSDTSTSIVIPQKADFLVAVNAHLITESDTTSEYIQILMDTIANNSASQEPDDLVSVLVSVQRQLSEREPNWLGDDNKMPFRLNYSTLTRKLYLKRVN